ncbi:MULTISPECIES: acetolactate synthase small subunit [unclassified Devosia]|uniref:acetolactate synthase small subunit n=1 Tax=unclassified Devosia TaxID=196773 RepID=UPI00145C9A7B|nr:MULTISPECIES: acetolactate synthase small subunit [unclassified Devosia]MBJ6986581.1 acetolactate synthase small subunit [Devosia sp. MC521]MBJ7577050.1 acetolactate synthase small subunit [Devosia sp. MC532]MBK1793719.1 acetolactate synthase small subunit [Devosia sp. WQ 349K1]QMW61625.1 acetolactate synthase small subunit [Devosia sp. MC521]
MNAHLQPTGSAYFMAPETQQNERHTLSVLVDNEPGILARVVSLFSARGYNIESLTVSETEHDSRLSRITVVVIATPKVLIQIKSQLERLVPVHKVHDLSAEGAFVERELALIKVRGSGDHRAETLRLADAFRAHIIDSTVESFVFEVTGKPEKIDSFIALMAPLGLVEVVRTGLAAISRGPESM